MVGAGQPFTASGLMCDEDLEAKLIKIKQTLNAFDNKGRASIIFRDQTKDKLLHLQRRVAETRSILNRRMLDKLH